MDREGVEKHLCIDLAEKRGYYLYMGSLTDALSGAGLPTDVGSNVQAPSLSDLGGSLGDKATGINAGTTGAYTGYAGSMSGLGGAQNPNTTYQDLLVQNGIPQLQKTAEGLTGTVNDLTSSIQRVRPNVQANTGNSLVTQAQQDGMITNQRLPMQELLGPLSSNLSSVENSLGTQEQNISDQVNAQNTNNSLINTVGQMGVSVAQDNAARTMTGYTTDAQNMLQGLLQKMSITGTLDASEWSTLSTLATQQQSYQQQLSTIAAGQKYQNVGAGNTLVNTQTGKTFTAGGTPAATYTHP